MFSRLNFLGISVLLVMGPMCAAGQVTVKAVPDRQTDTDGAVFSDQGNIRVAVREVGVVVSTQSGRDFNKFLLVIYDARSGHFFWDTYDAPTWHHQALSDMKNARGLYLTIDSIVEFYASRSFISIQQFDGTASSLGDATEQAIHLVGQTTNFDGLSTTWRSRGGVEVQIDARLPRDFFEPALPTSAAPEPPPQVIGVERKSGKWIVTLRKEWKAELTLSSNFRLLSWRRVE